MGSTCTLNAGARGVLKSRAEVDMSIEVDVLQLYKSLVR